MKQDLRHVAERCLEKRTAFLELAKKHQTPFYVFDKDALDSSAEAFQTAFSKEIPRFKAYYALKLNHYAPLVKRVVEKGMGLDVASVREINLALAAGSKDIMYFSPGKTEIDLKKVMDHSNLITVNMDSFGELEKLAKIASKVGKEVSAGIRIHTDMSGDWKKYGINLSELNNFWMKAKECPFIKLKGIHFHMSRNKDASFYEDTFSRLGTYLKDKFDPSYLSDIAYIDFGGGFEPYVAEGCYIRDHSKGEMGSYQIREALMIDQYAARIGNAIKTHIAPIVDVEYRSEPGRVICNDAMAIVLSVADKKSNSSVILDGGVNMVGWQRFMHEYFPLVNLSSPSDKEIMCDMWGSLCTTWDIWGYRCYADSVNEKDVIVVPNQGALTYSLAQSFIVEIPPVYDL